MKNNLFVIIMICIIEILPFDLSGQEFNGFINYFKQSEPIQNIDTSFINSLNLNLYRSIDREKIPHFIWTNFVTPNETDSNLDYYAINFKKFDNYYFINVLIINKDYNHSIRKDTFPVIFKYIVTNGIKTFGTGYRAYKYIIEQNAHTFTYYQTSTFKGNIMEVKELYLTNNKLSWKKDLPRSFFNSELGYMEGIDKITNVNTSNYQQNQTLKSYKVEKSFSENYIDSIPRVLIQPINNCDTGTSYLALIDSNNNICYFLNKDFDTIIIAEIKKYGILKKYYELNGYYIRFNEVRTVKEVSLYRKGRKIKTIFYNHLIIK